MAALITAFVVSLAWCGFALWLGPKLGFLDLPDGSILKGHEQPAVPLGGVGILFAVVLAEVARGRVDGVLLTSSVVVVILGLIDDRRGLAPWVRLGVELVAAGVLVIGRSGSVTGVSSLMLGILLVTLAINAINLFDGLDGLAGSVGLVTALGVAWLASGRGFASEPSLELAAALGGFLVFGWHPARVFLGDAGAYLVGLLLASEMIRSSGGHSGGLLIASSLLGVFALDLIVTLIRRRLDHRPLFQGDRSHIYDQLRDRGMTTTGVVYLAVAVQAVLIVFIVAVDRLLDTEIAVLALLASGAALTAMVAYLGFLKVDVV